MYGALLLIALLMMAYGVVRFVMALIRREEHPTVHVLWIPGSALLFAASIAFYTWVII